MASMAEFESARVQDENEELRRRVAELEGNALLPPVKHSLYGVVWEKVREYHKLQAGDHVSYKDDYWHHAIVEAVPEEQVVSLILWAIGKPEIVRKDIKLELGGGLHMERAEYTKGCYDNDLVVRRAQARVGETDYGFVTNFARAFPEWCKTGTGRLTHSDTDADNRYKMAVLEQRNTISG